MPDLDPDNPRTQQMMDLFAAHQRRLLGFINALVPSPADADEILQETNLVIWKKFDQFDPDAPGSDFLAWAFRIAQYQVLDYRKRHARRRVTFATDVVEQLTERATEQSELLDRRREALPMCVAKLGADDRALLEACYRPGAKVDRVAGEMGRKTTSVYRTLRRIRGMLAECIDNALAGEDAR